VVALAVSLTPPLARPTHGSGATEPASTFTPPGAGASAMLSPDPTLGYPMAIAWASPDPPSPMIQTQHRVYPTVEEARAWLWATLDAQDAACLSWIVNAEDGWQMIWNTRGSGAYGLPQAKPASKMASAGTDWLVNPITQLKWMVDYVDRKYGGPCGAWSWWQAHGWY